MGVEGIDRPATSRKIKALLKQKGIDIKTVRDRMRFSSVQAIYKWIDPNCVTLPDLDDLAKLADMIGVGVEDILVLSVTEDDSQSGS